MEPSRNGEIMIVGYAYGSFDLFCVEDLTFLEQAKQLCDFLIVGVLTDEVVDGGDPVMPYEDRLRLVAALKCVNMVVCQPVVDPTAALKETRPDILFCRDMGGEIPGAEYMESVRGRVASPYHPNISSRDIVERIVSRHLPGRCRCCEEE